MLQKLVVTETELNILVNSGIVFGIRDVWSLDYQISQGQVILDFDSRDEYRKAHRVLDRDLPSSNALTG